MKDHRFIELVNLYVDRQISAAETAELEAELQVNPRRRAIYRQYCQMQRATSMVYDSFRANASEQPAVEAGEVVVARFERQRAGRRTSWIHYAGGLAAACLVATFIVRQNTTPQPAEVIVSAPVKVSHAVAVTSPAPAAVMPAMVVEARKGPVSLRNNTLAADQDYAAMLLALRREEQRAFANGQIQSGRVPASLFEDGVFDPQATPANSRRATQQGEFTAFQFQR